MTPQIIVATGVSQEINAKQQVKLLVERVKQNLSGNKPNKGSADSGHYSEDNIKYLSKEQIDAYVATAREKHCDTPRHTVKVREIYNKRKQIVEPVFGQIKEDRGLRRFLLRGFDNITAA